MVNNLVQVLIARERPFQGLVPNLVLIKLWTYGLGTLEFNLEIKFEFVKSLELGNINLNFS